MGLIRVCDICGERIIDGIHEYLKVEYSIPNRDKTFTKTIRTSFHKECAMKNTKHTMKLIGDKTNGD